MSDSESRVVVDEVGTVCGTSRSPHHAFYCPRPKDHEGECTDILRRRGTSHLRGRPLDDNGAIEFEGPKAGWVNGTLYCYGGCGTRYADFVRDVTLSTSLWNRIAVGPPFDEMQKNIEREGRGGVLCPACIVKRLAALPDCTVILMDIR